MASNWHVVYDGDADRPIYAAITPARTNDITAAQAMPIEPGATYVFDLGYYDYAWWKRLDDAQCRIVTRFKRNTALAVIEELPGIQTRGGLILSDRIGFCYSARAAAGATPMPSACGARGTDHDRYRQGSAHSVHRSGGLGRGDCRSLQAALGDRVVLPMDQTGPDRITRFLGISENAALHPDRFVALIAFLLLRLAQAGQRAINSPLRFAGLVRANLKCIASRSIAFTQPRTAANPQSRSTWPSIGNS